MGSFRLLKDFYKLRKNLYKSVTEIETEQKQKLSELLQYAYRHSDYYRDVFEKAGISEEELAYVDLQKLPILDKKTLFEHFDEITTVTDVTQEEMRTFDAEVGTNERTMKNRYHIVHSSGSTGLPSYFLYDNSAWNTMLLGIIRGALWGMSLPQIGKLLIKGARIAYLAATDGRYGGVMAVGDGIDGLHARQIQLDINMPTDKWIREILSFNPNVIIGYPSAIKILAELMEKGAVLVKPVRVISCGEPLDLGLREYLEDIFGVSVINFYGASESLALGVEANREEGMFLFDDLNLIESIDGKMYLTCLYNFAQPLIRYEITDSLTKEPAKKKACYPFSKVRGLVGRDEDILWFTDPYGKREFLHPLSVEGICVEHLTDYQFQQRGDSHLILFAEVAKSGCRDLVQTEIRQWMDRILGEKELDFVDYEVQFVEQILPDPKTGKKKLIRASEV